MKVTIEITKEDMLDPRGRHELTSSMMAVVKEMWQQSKELAKQFQEEEGLQQQEQEPKEQEESKEESKEESQAQQPQQQVQQAQEQAPETEYTLNYIRALANEKARSITNGKERVTEIIKKYGVKGLSSIKESDYSAFVQDLGALQ